MNSIKTINLYNNHNQHHSLILRRSTTTVDTKLNLFNSLDTISDATVTTLSLPLNAWSSTLSIASSYLSLSSLSSLSIADGLDAETLSALGDAETLSDVQDLTDALNDAIDVSNPTADVLTRLVDSPLILLIPIGAGLLVASGVGFLIYSYGKGNE